MIKPCYAIQDRVSKNWSDIIMAWNDDQIIREFTQIFKEMANDERHKLYVKDSVVFGIGYVDFDNDHYIMNSFDVPKIVLIASDVIGGAS